MNRSAIIGATMALTMASTMLPSTIPTAQAQTGAPEQIQLAKPGGDWVLRGSGPFARYLGSWSADNMSPGEVRSRSYFIRNMDARPGTWTVAVGDYQASDHALFAIGTEAKNLIEVPVDNVQTIAQTYPPLPAPMAPPLNATDVAWLAGNQAELQAGITAARPGEVLARIQVPSCGIATVTDWVAFPNVSDQAYQGQQVSPQIEVTFTPNSGDPDTFQPGNCDTATTPPTAVPPTTPPTEPPTAVPPTTPPTAVPPTTTAPNPSGSDGNVHGSAPGTHQSAEGSSLGKIGHTVSTWFKGIWESMLTILRSCDWIWWILPLIALLTGLAYWCWDTKERNKRK